MEEEFYFDSDQGDLIMAISHLLDKKFDILFEKLGGELEVETGEIEKDVMTIEEAANYLGVSKVTIHNWLKRNNIQSFKKGKYRFFKTSYIKKFYESGRERTMQTRYVKTESPYFQEKIANRRR